MVVFSMPIVAPVVAPVTMAPPAPRVELLRNVEPRTTAFVYQKPTAPEPPVPEWLYENVESVIVTSCDSSQNTAPAHTFDALPLNSEALMVTVAVGPAKIAPAGPLALLSENVELCTFSVPSVLTAPPPEM